MPYCPECGAEVPDDGRFCPECGADVAQDRGGGEPGGHRAPVGTSSGGPRDTRTESGVTSFEIGTVFGDSVERIATSVGALLIAGIAFFGVVRTAAGQDIARGTLEWILAELEDPELREQLGPEQLEALEAAETELNAVLADLPLALGLSPGAAALVWIVGYVLGLVVAVLALDAFGQEWDTPGEIDASRIGWKTLNLFFGTIVFGILFVIGLVLFVLPGLAILVLLVFFPAAIVLDDESFFEAFGSSVGVVRENVGGAILLVIAGIAVGIAVSIVTAVVGAGLPSRETVIVSELFSAVGLAFVLALLARAYADATGEGGPEPADEPGGPEATGSGDEPQPADEFDEP